jgi:hypothetical protein
MNAMVVVADVAVTGTLACRQCCMPGLSPSFRKVPTEFPFTSTSTALVVPKPPFRVTTLPTENVNVY